MNEPSLLVMCLNAFVAVLVLLSVLALVMRLLLIVFPASGAAVTAGHGGDAHGGGDPALAAAISVAAQMVVPGARVTRIEEQS
jgi:hypothetical protein